MLSLPFFGETDFTLHQMNKTARVLLLPDRDADAFYRYFSYFEKRSFIQRDFRTAEHSLYAAFQGKEESIFLNYFKNTGELQLVAEQDCRYFEFCGRKGAAITTPQITQLHLSDFGMCYIIRLSDERFILIDGGNRFEADADRLYDFLQKSCHGTPTIAAWILTHPHSDHYHGLFPFFERHGEKIKVERFLLNFPEADDLAHYPKLAEDDDRLPHDASEQANIPLLDRLIEGSGALRYMPHTGQSFKIGDAEIEMLSSMEDSIHCSQNINAASLVFRMKLGGQIFLWTADANFEACRLPERYGAYLKSDILQVPHHGFGCGDTMIQIEGFKWIAPETCLLPVSDYHAYTAFSGYREGTRFLMEELGISELITGDQTTTLPLPYTPHPSRATALAANFRKGRQDNGARTWVFTDLSTARAEDFAFTALNMTYLPQRIEMDLFFEDRSFNIEHLLFEAKPGTINHFSILDPAQVGIKDEFSGDRPLDPKALPENKPFAVRFTCKEPIVIFHQDRKETYHSIY